MRELRMLHGIMWRESGAGFEFNLAMEPSPTNHMHHTQSMRNSASYRFALEAQAFLEPHRLDVARAWAACIRDVFRTVGNSGYGFLLQ